MGKTHMTFAGLVYCHRVKPSAQTTRTYGRYGGRMPLRVKPSQSLRPRRYVPTFAMEGGALTLTLHLAAQYRLIDQRCTLKV